MINAFLSRQFFAFLVTGGIAAIVNFGSRIAYNYFVSFSTAVVLAYLTGMVTAFILIKLFVFTKSQQKIHHSVVLFSLVNIAAVAQTWIISMGLLYYLFPAWNITLFAPELAHAVGIIVPVFTSYIGHKRWSFR